MTRLVRLAALATLLLPVPALAAPAMMGYAGILTDSAGAPLSGPTDFVIRMFDASSSGNLLFEETLPNQTVTNGHFFLVLANNEVVSGDALDVLFSGNDTVYLEVEVETQVLAPLQRLVSVPWSLAGAGGGGAWGSLAGIPDPVIALAATTPGTGGCTDGKVLKVSGSAWDCGDDNAGAGGLPACAAGTLVVSSGASYVCLSGANSGAHVQNTTAAGHALRVSGGGEAGADNEGALVVGDPAGENLGFDGNEILARNNGVGSILNLQNEGGGVRIGDNTAGQVAVPGAASAGMRIKLYGAVSAMAAGDYAVGIESGHMWFNSGGGFKWYEDSTNVGMHLQSGGLLYLPANDDAGPTGGGTLTIGPVAGEHIGIDGNEIQFYNGAAVEDANLNVSGGDVAIGNATSSIDMNGPTVLSVNGGNVPHACAYVTESGTASNFVIDCPANRFPITGGCHGGGGTDYIIASFPVNGGSAPADGSALDTATGWGCILNGNASGQNSGYVLCCRY